MEKKGIEIEIEISQDEKCKLVLTPQNYRSQFREFIRERGFDQRQAFLIKNLVQSKMISVYNGYEEKQQTKMSKLSIKEEEEVEREMVISPKFGRLETKQTQTDQKIEPEVKYFPSKQKQEEESIISTKMQSMMTPNNHILKEEELAQKMWSQSEFNVKTQGKQYTTEEKHYHQQSSPSMPTVKRLEQDKYGNVETTPHKKKSYMVHSPSQNLDRLYETTQSFRKKKNKDIDHKQQQDYQQVEKYLMNQQLKRTTQRFFNNLYQTPTASSKGKSHSKEKESIKEEQLPLPSPPSKKVSPEKCYKGSSRPSGCRCEMKIVQQQRQKQLKKEREEQKLIKKRMIESKKSPPVQPQPNAHKSRSCQKCNPPVSPKKPNTQKPRPRMPQPKKTVPRPYLSNLLADSYNQFISQIPHFQQ